MTPEELLRAIGQVDGELVQEAEEYRPPARRGAPARWRPALGGLAAACLVAAVLTHLPAVGDQSSGGAAADMTGQAAESSAAAGASGGEQEQTAQDPSSQPEAGSAPSSGEGASNSAALSGDALRTPAGEYRLTGEILPELPEGSRQLGVLFLDGQDSGNQLYTGRKEYAGCMLWEDPAGLLYVQLPGGGYAAARPAS